MNINFNPAVGNNTNFRAVSQKYMKTAEKCYKGYGNITSRWYYSLRDDVFMWKGISQQDAIDTLLAVKKWVNEESMGAFNHILESIKRG